MEKICMKKKKLKIASSQFVQGNIRSEVRNSKLMMVAKSHDVLPYITSLGMDSLSDSLISITAHTYNWLVAINFFPSLQSLL